MGTYHKTIDQLRSVLIKGQTDGSISSYLLFVAAENRPKKELLEKVLAENEKNLLGGVFPEIIADGERYKNGFALIPLEEHLQVAGFEWQKDSFSSENEIRHWLENKPFNSSSVFCFINAFWTKKNAFLNGLYEIFGPFVNYLGGGAGSLEFKSFPCVISNQKVFENGAVIGLMNKKVQLGVAHGWHSISDPIRVTETEGNKIISLNWKPAFDIYVDLVAAHYHHPISLKNFFDVAKSYPLGLVRLDDEMIVRDVYATEKGRLHMVDEVPEGEYIRIMHGDLASLLNGAQDAVNNAYKSSASSVNQVCFDCISRVLFMQSEFTQELSFLNQHQQMDGALSIGEIANIGSASLELFNKTVVVAQWKKTN
jgi:hypothetical protein